ncbi:MAG TPA: hypothetical protein VK504_22205 [Vicinamibacterales bacterium]|nr:hypothetical protein [Vicinamibacterales bacterium]
MTWRALNYGTAENEEGTQVSRRGFRDVTYSHAGRQVTVDVEPGDRNLAVYTRSIKKWSDGAAVNEEERAKIVKDIEEAFRVLRVPIQIF